MSADLADDMEAIDRVARTNLNVVDLARYDDYKKRLLADGSRRVGMVRALRAYISISTKVEDEDAGA
jgi:hypothetical protein